MKFPVDAQLPRRSVTQLLARGCDTVHTRSLTLGNRTPDEDINDRSLHEQRVVITKDADFVTSFLLQRRPYKLLLVSTGNISNQDLELLFQANIAMIAAAFVSHDFLELTRTTVVTHV